MPKQVVLIFLIHGKIDILKGGDIMTNEEKALNDAKVELERVEDVSPANQVAIDEAKAAVVEAEKAVAEKE